MHLRKVLELLRLYGCDDVLAALAQATEYRTFDAAYVETLLLQERRRRELPSPVPLRPKRLELLDETVFDEPDPAIYDRLYTGLVEATDVAPPTSSSSACDVSPCNVSAATASDTASDSTSPPTSPDQEPTHA